MAAPTRGAGKARRPSPADHRRAAERFNRDWPVGSRVRYWSALREGPPTGEGVTATEAQVHGGDYAAVYVARDSGGTCLHALTHVEPVAAG